MTATLLFRSAAFAACAFICGDTMAQVVAPEVDKSRVWEPGTSSPSLPTPPEKLRQVMRSGNVRVQLGGPPPTGRESKGDDQVHATYLRPPTGRSALDAETHFSVQFSYLAKFTWSTFRTGNGRKIRIRLRFKRIKIQPQHLIWLRTPDVGPTALKRDPFWHRRLVLHELDHVRISTRLFSDEGLGKDLRGRTLITRPISDSFVINEASVQELVDEMVYRRFDDYMELVDIRYRELDRVTGHGRRDLPADSALHELVRRRD